MKDASSIDYSALMAFVDPNNYQDSQRKYFKPVDVERLAEGLRKCAEMDEILARAARKSPDFGRQRVDI